MKSFMRKAFGYSFTSIVFLVSSQAWAGSVTAGDRRLPPALQVEFVSIGAGIDFEFFKSLNFVAGDFLKNGEMAHYSVKGVRGALEGELTVCLEFRNGAVSQEFKKLLDAQPFKPAKTVRFTSRLNCGSR
jgi:hypothetical protein